MTFNGLASAHPEVMDDIRREYRKLVWDQMMLGNADAWCEFFKYISNGGARRMIAENSRLPR